MDAVSTGKESLITRFSTLQNAMCQTSERYEAGCPEYMEVLIDLLSELRLGCVMSVFPPARMPACVRCDDTFTVACWMDIVDMESDLVIRTECRSSGKDKGDLSSTIVRKTFESAGMAETEGPKVTRYLDVARRLPLCGRPMVTPEAPYVCV